MDDSEEESTSDTSNGETSEGDDEIKQVGDLGQIEPITILGTTHVNITDSLIGLVDGDSNNILKRSIVIHQEEEVIEDGDRIACGVIEPCDSTCQEILMTSFSSTFREI